jgi:excisionase family DNA binding protein
MEDMTMELTKAFYSPREMAAMVGVHPSTVMAWIHSGRLRAIKLSERTYRIPNKAVVKMLAPELANPPVFIERPDEEVDPHMLDDDSEWIIG